MTRAEGPKDKKGSFGRICGFRPADFALNIPMLPRNGQIV
jgi:hypothetical protein